jgi:hypothetical protein
LKPKLRNCGHRKSSSGILIFSTRRLEGRRMPRFAHEHAWLLGGNDLAERGDTILPRHGPLPQPWCSNPISKLPRD